MGSCYRYTNAEKCVNCGWNMLPSAYDRTSAISKYFDYRVGELPESHKELLTSWLPPLDDLAKYPVCRDCHRLLYKLAEAPRPVERQRSHKEVCAACGESIFKKRSNALSYERPEHELLRPYVQLHQGESWLLPLRVCNKCQKKCQRDRDRAHYQQMKFGGVYMNVSADSEKYEPEDEEATSPEPETSTKKVKREKKPLPVKVIVKEATAPKKAREEKREKQKPRIVNTVTLNGYYKLRVESSAVCSACGEVANLRINLATRQHFMLHQNLYVPNSANVCRRHRKAANWPSNLNKSLELTSDEVCDMLFLCMRERAVNFRNVETLHPFRMQEWFGVDLEEYQEMLQQSPVLSQHPNGRFALSVYLAKRKKRESTTVLASVSQQSESFVSACLKLATECLQPTNSEEPQDERNEDGWMVNIPQYF